MEVVEVTDLHKSYGDLDAVRGVSFAVGEGEVVALVGPNGAGKTTTVEILEGYRDRTSGDVRVLGFDPARQDVALRERIGIVLQEAGVYPELTVGEAVRLHASYYPHPRPVDEVLAMVGLTDRHDTRIKALSGGQRRRADLALGIIGDPDLLFLDEPTTGFDPGARRHAWDVIDGLRALGTTILLTTHYMDEAQQLADRVIVIAGGRIVAEGDPSSLGGRDHADATIAFRLTDPLARLGLPTALAATIDGADILLASHDVAGDLYLLTSWARAGSYDLDGLRVDRPTLEDTYLALVGDGETTTDA